MNHDQRRPPGTAGDSGSALLITLMVMALVAALATTVATLSIRNMQSARLSQQGGVASAAADAGVAQAVSYLRANGVHDLCPSPAPYNPQLADFNKGFDLASQSCVTNMGAAQRVPGQPYSVVIVTGAAYPSNDLGSYTIFSRGVGAERAARLVAADITVTGVGTPRGFFGHAIFGGGGATVSQSIFTTGCVYKRTHIVMPAPADGLDAYGLPVAVHSSQVISDDLGSTVDCVAGHKAIHKDGACALAQPFDQDALGGSLTGTGCVTARPASVPLATWQKFYPDGSKIASPQALLSLYGIKDPALTQPDIDRLRVTALTQGNFRTTTSSSDVVTPKGSQAVLFYDLRATGGTVDLSGIQGFGFTAGACPTRSLVVVVVGGSAVFNSGAPLVASVFVTTKGQMYSANGGKLVGSVYADLINLGGNTQVAAEASACAASNPSPTLLDFVVTTYRELDN